MKRRIAAIFLAAMLLSGCANDYKKVTVTSCHILNNTEIGLKQGKMHATVGVEASVDNKSGSKFEISEANATVYEKDGTEFGTVTAACPVVVEPRKTQTLTVSLDLAVNDPMALLFGGIPSFNEKNVDIYITAKQNGVGPKKIEMKNIPANTLLNQIKVKMQ